MERPRAIAWAGSIVLAGSAGAFVLGSLLEGLGSGGSRIPLPPASSSPAPGGHDAAPAPEEPAAGPELSDTGGPQPAGNAQPPPGSEPIVSVSSDPPAGRAIAPATIPALRIVVQIESPPRPERKRTARPPAADNSNSLKPIVQFQLVAGRFRADRIIRPGGLEHLATALREFHFAKPKRTTKAGVSWAPGTKGDTRAPNPPSDGEARTVSVADDGRGPDETSQ